MDRYTNYHNDLLHGKVDGKYVQGVTNNTNSKQTNITQFYRKKYYIK